MGLVWFGDFYRRRADNFACLAFIRAEPNAAGRFVLIEICLEQLGDVLQEVLRMC